MTLSETDELGSVLGNSIKDQSTIQENMSPDESDTIAILFSSEAVIQHENTVKISTRNVSTDALYDFDKWDECNWEGDYDNAAVTFKIASYNNTFYEFFYTDNYKDTSNTTATWTGNGSLVFAAGTVQTAQSDTLTTNLGNITRAKIVEIDGTGDYQNADIYLSNDDGVSATKVSVGTFKTFTTTGSKLRWRIDNKIGSGFPTPFGTWGLAGTAMTITKLKLVYEVA